MRIFTPCISINRTFKTGFATRIWELVFVTFAVFVKNLTVRKDASPNTIRIGIIFTMAHTVSLVNIFRRTFQVFGCAAAFCGIALFTTIFRMVYQIIGISSTIAMVINLVVFRAGNLFLSCRTRRSLFKPLTFGILRI